MQIQKALQSATIAFSIFFQFALMVPEQAWSMDLEKGLIAAMNGDLKTALIELEPLAEQGNVEAQFSVALIYMQLAAYEPAEELLRKADSAGHPDASYYIGLIFRNGLNGKHNPEEAVKWFFRSASFGHREAYYNLHIAYDSGLGGVEKDQEAAFMYALAAAELGHADAQYKLGMFYSLGEGAVKDLVLAHMWLEIAAFSETFDYPPRNARTELNLTSGETVREMLLLISEILPLKQRVIAEVKARTCVKQDFINCNQYP